MVIKVKNMYVVNLQLYVYHHLSKDKNQAMKIGIITPYLMDIYCNHFKKFGIERYEIVIYTF